MDAIAPSVAANPVTLPAADAGLRFQALSIPEAALAAHRRALYHSEGPGFVIVRGFVDCAVVEHMRTLWSTLDHRRTHRPFVNKEMFHDGCPDYAAVDEEGNASYYNFFFNQPVDEVTWTVSLYVHMLRNRLMGRQGFVELFPSSGRSVSYRVVISRNRTIWIPPHRDNYDTENKFDRNRYDLSRLQATLFLSEKGVDYDGEGFCFWNNAGERLVFGTDVAVRPGDLVIWRYVNLHGVLGVSARPGQIGFMRILYPPEIAHPRPDGRGKGWKDLKRQVNRHIHAALVRPGPVGYVRGLLGKGGN